MEQFLFQLSTSPQRLRSPSVSEAFRGVLVVPSLTSLAVVMLGAVEDDENIWPEWKSDLVRAELIKLGDALDEQQRKLRANTLESTEVELPRRARDEQKHDDC